VGPLVAQLNHPNKVVWRAAAWALRGLGNFGTGVEAVRQALRSPDPLMRRGACRIFAYQFFGMDEDLGLCHRLMELTGDPDLWTRLQALKTLRQWFYRTADPAVQREIIDTYIARMGVPGEPASVRSNLAQGMYIMLDENLAGGVSLAVNLNALPAANRERAFADRRRIEKEVLLGPVFAALASGNALQREALLRSFDGSFLKGRFYARNPRPMIDVGNDREFDFLYTPPQDRLDRTFLAVFEHEAVPAVRQTALRLADFFHLPAVSTDPRIQRVLLEGLRDPDPSVRAAATELARTTLALSGAHKVPETLALLRGLMQDERVDRAALVRAVGRNRDLVDDPELRRGLRALLGRPDSWRVLLPVLGHPAFHDEEVLAAVDGGWSAARDPAERTALLDLLAGRKVLSDRRKPPEKVVFCLRRGATDPSVAVREQTFTLLAGLKALWPTSTASRLLYIGLADDSPTIRMQCLKLGAGNPDLWDRAETAEYVLRLLVDPDRKIRAEALAAVERHDLLRREPRLARRLKSVMADPEAALSKRAEALLRAHHLNPAKVQADVVVQRPRLLSLGYFRRVVNPVFYQAGPDGQSCAKCHVNHSILRLAEPPPAGRTLGAEEVMLNYSSVLKVINLGDPEQSLLLRKPRSPHGQGNDNPDSPTGLTHVGGPRWDSTHHDAYVKVLNWLRSSHAGPRKGPVPTVSADSYAPDYPPRLAADGEPGTYWHTEYTGAVPGYPHEFVLDLGRPHQVGGLVYVPRTDGSTNGRVKDYEVYVSADGKDWGRPLARGTWLNDATTKYVIVPPTRARYVKLRGLSEVTGQPVMSAAEIDVDVEE
jgi:hypothetical protein